jgi:hypothetical protein
MTKIKIGVIGENSNDVRAVVGLLKQRFATDIEYFEILNKVNGSLLDQGKGVKAAELAKAEFRRLKLDFVLYIRDLDSLANDVAKIEYRTVIFTKMLENINYKGIFMLNIYEIEALILADFEVFKTYYKNTEWHFEAEKATIITDSKGVLSSFSNKKTDITAILPLLRIPIIIQNHIHFKAFVENFDTMLDGRTYCFVPI